MTLGRHPPSLVLAPIDQGVRNVGGRDGTREGPQALLEALEEESRLPSAVNVRTVPVTNQPDTLEEDLDALSRAVQDVLMDDRTPIILGGDHGTTYASVRGAARAHPSLGVCYLDVHYDMRPHEPRHTSGSSFRRLLDEGIVPPSRLAPLGIQPPSPDDPEGTTAQLAQYAKDAGVSWVPLDQAKKQGPGRLARERMNQGAWYASFDTDALSQEHAPGVSAPGPNRFTPAEARSFLDAAVDEAIALDIVEYAPRLDTQGRTRETLVDLLGHVLDRLPR